MHRLFVALRPPAAVRAQLRATMTGVAGARWQSDEQLHLTLRFLGDVPAHQAEDAALALAGVHHPPVTIALAGVGTFGPEGRPNALWAGVRPHDALARLHRKIDQALVRTGLAPEGRAYLPHITLARLNAASGSVAGFVAAQIALASPPFRLEHFALYESQLARTGARYIEVARYPLAAPADPA